MDKIYDVIIIGAGPAGMTAAIYAKRAELETLLIEKNFMGGGQILNTYEIDNFPGFKGFNGFDLGQKFSEHVDELGVERISEEVRSVELAGEIKTIRTEEGEYRTKTVVLATGASPKKLGAPGEEKLSGMGVSYCATCDGAFYRGKTTVVVGGGDVAVEDAIFLARGCEKVYVVHRRDELRAVKTLQTALFALPNVEMVWDSKLKSINGSDGKVTSVTVVNKYDKSERVIDTDGVFIAVGITPRSGFVGTGIETNAGGYIVAGETCETSIPGVFAAGDVRAKQLRQVVTAVADGANAVTSVQRYLLESAEK